MKLSLKNVFRRSLSFYCIFESKKRIYFSKLIVNVFIRDYIGRSLKNNLAFYEVVIIKRFSAFIIILLRFLIKEAYLF